MSIRDIDIRRIGEIYVTPISNIKESVREDYSFDTCELVRVDYDCLCDLVDECDVEYYDFDEFMRDDYVESLIGDADKYLVFARSVRWDGADGYAIYDNKVDCFMRDYDCSIYEADEERKDMNVLNCVEYSHDCPTGCRVTVMGITNEQYDKIMYSEDEFEVINDLISEVA